MQRYVFCQCGIPQITKITGRPYPFNKAHQQMYRATLRLVCAHSIWSRKFSRGRLDCREWWKNLATINRQIDSEHLLRTMIIAHFSMASRRVGIKLARIEAKPPLQVH